jgi:hypothetical protein
MSQWARQSTCVAIEGRAMLIDGAPGAANPASPLR